MIQIFEHELKHKQGLIIDKIKYHINADTSVIGARKCKIVKLSNLQTTDFF